MIRQVRLNRTLLSCLLLLLCTQLAAQGVAVPGDTCKPASARTQDIGCWILADNPVGQLAKPQVFWHFDVYPTRVAAEADKGPRGTVIESFGKVWLMTIEDENWKSAHGNRIAEIGPLSVVTGEKYSAQFMEADFTPRNDGTRTHTLRPGGLVRGRRRNMSGNLRWSHADQPRRRPPGNRSHGIINAPHRYWLRTAPFDRDRPPSVIAAPDHNGP